MASTTRLLTVALALLVGLALAATTDGQVAQAAGKRKMALGVNISNDRDIAQVDAFTASLGGNAPAMWAIQTEWGSPATHSFPTEFAGDLKDRGIVPLINWLPLDPANPDSASYRYKRILAGRHDAYIREWAAAARDHAGTIVLRFAPEMNGHWFPWGIGRFDNTAKRFKKAWRYVWRLVRGEGGVGATNVKFLWSPNKPCSVCRPDYERLYPGDRYVHYVGFSSFNWGAIKTWTPMVKGYQRAVARMMKLTQRSIIVAETASHWKGGNKAAWIRNGYLKVYRLWPRIKGIVYLNVDMRWFANHPDWRLHKPAAALEAYADIAARRKFQGTIK